jgi:ammonia channel protein AmtB
MAAGTIILWVGFYGFNSGSVNLGDKNPDEWIYEVARVAVNTTACAAFAGFTCFAITFRRRDPAPEDTFNAVIGGLVSACATSSLVQPYAAAIIGRLRPMRSMYLWNNEVFCELI